MVRTRAYLTMVTASGVMLVADVVFAISLANGQTTGGTPFCVVLWLVAYLLLGAAGLDASVARSSGLTEGRTTAIGWVRVAMFAVLGLLGPVVRVITALAGATEPGLWRDIVVPATAVAVLSLLLVIRLVLLAEGVETAEQAEMLRAMNRALAQGNLFGRPREPAAIDALAGAERLSARS